jgi:hypothetical protein
MSNMEALDRKIAVLEEQLGTNKALVDAGTITDGAERVAIRQQISSDTTRLTALEERREVRLQQQQQAGEHFVRV